MEEEAYAKAEEKEKKDATESKVSVLMISI